MPDDWCQWLAFYVYRYIYKTQGTKFIVTYSNVTKPREDFLFPSLELILPTALT